MKVDGTGLRQITPPGTLLSDGGGGNDWSPQGNDIVFSQRVTPDCAQLALGRPRRRQRPARDPRPRPTGLRQPDLRPDRARLLQPALVAGRHEDRLQHLHDATGRSIYTVNADGTGLTQVTHGDDDQSPDWGTHPLTR